MSLQLKVAKGRSLGMRGDPGLFGTIGKAIKGVAQAWLPNVFGSKVLAGTPPFAAPAGNSITKFLAPLVRPQNKVAPGGYSGGVPAPFTPIPIPDIGGMGWGQGAPAWPTNKNGQPRRQRQDGKPYKRPSMNFANGRAIKRSARRLEGAEKMFRRVFSIRHGAVHGKILPKRG